MQSIIANRRAIMASIAATAFAAIAAYNDCQLAAAQVSEGSEVEWLAGKKLQRQRLVSVSVSWVNSPIRDQLVQFSKQQKRGIFIDRRVDPSIQLQVQPLSRTTEQVLWHVADENGLAIANVGGLFYVGPPTTAARLPWAIAAAKKRAAKLSRSAKKRFSAKTELRWQAATSTREIATWFESRGIQFANQLPHDVWPASDWPNLSLLEQLFLVAAGFEKEPHFSADGTTVLWTDPPLLKEQTIKVKYDQFPGVDVRAIADGISGLKVRGSKKVLTAKGDVASIMNLQKRLVEAQTPKSSDKTIDLLTFKAEGPRRAIIQSIATRLGYEIEVPDAASEALNSHININIEGATLGDVLKKCLAGSELTHRIDGRTIRILEQ